MKATKNDCENNKDDKDSSYLSNDFDRSRFNSSAEALGFSPIKPVGKRDALSYAQNKAKRMKAGLNEKLAINCTYYRKVRNIFSQRSN